MTAPIKNNIKNLHPDSNLDDIDIAQLAAGLEPLPLAAGAREDLKQRVLQAALAARAPSNRVDSNRVVRAEADHWVDLLPGVRVKALRIDRVQRTHTSLWRMAAGACLPEHDHSAEEECLVISGAVDWSGERYDEGDYLLVQSGFRHTEIQSREGATLLIRGELTARLEQVFAAHV